MQRNPAASATNVQSKGMRDRSAALQWSTVDGTNLPKHWFATGPSMDLSCHGDPRRWHERVAAPKEIGIYDAAQAAQINNKNAAGKPRSRINLPYVGLPRGDQSVVAVN